MRSTARARSRRLYSLAKYGGGKVTRHWTIRRVRSKLADTRQECLFKQLRIIRPSSAIARDRGGSLGNHEYKQQLSATRWRWATTRDFFSPFFFAQNRAVVIKGRPGRFTENKKTLAPEALEEFTE